MSHVALVNEAIFWLVVSMPVLLVLFLCAVIWTPPEPSGSPPPTVQRSAFEALPPKRQLWTAPLPAGTAGQSGAASYAATQGHTTMPVENALHQPKAPGAPWDLAPGEPNIVHRPTVSGKPPWGPAPKPPGIL